MRSTRRGRLRRPFRGAVAAFAATLMFGGLSPVTPAGAAGTCAPGDLPDVFPVADLEAGMMGTGWTVIEGMDPVPFDVEILGVLEDGIAPGLDFILVETSGPVIDETGGIAAGFSGSPVYIGSELVGAIAYGFSAADQRIGGVTPAEAMLDVVSYPEAVTAARAPRVLSLPDEVAIPASLRKAAARASGTPASTFSSAASRLVMPMSVSGLNDRAIDALQANFTERNWPVSLYRGGTISGTGLSALDPLAPGDSLAGVVSTGDLSLGGVGTVTVVCGDVVLGFGHPFFFEGTTNLGMNQAEILTVVPDPSSTNGGFKIGKIGASHGVIDQDRLAAIRGRIGVDPEVIAIDSEFDNLDLDRSRVGHTDVMLEDAFPTVAAFHTLGNWDAVFDQISQGTVRIDWTVNGLRQNGDPFTVSRQDMYFSDFDAAFESVLDMNGALEALLRNGFEDVTFTDLSLDGTITEDELQAAITKVQTRSSLMPTYKVRSVVKVRPGTLLRFKVFMSHADGSEIVVPAAVRIPFNATGSTRARVEGGGFDYGYYYGTFGLEDHDQFESFDDLVARIEGEARAFDLMISLWAGNPTFRRHKVLPQDHIVTGERTFRVVVVSG